MNKRTIGCVVVVIVISTIAYAAGKSERQPTEIKTYKCQHYGYTDDVDEYEYIYDLQTVFEAYSPKEAAELYARDYNSALRNNEREGHIYQDEIIEGVTRVLVREFTPPPAFVSYDVTTIFCYEAALTTSTQQSNSTLFWGRLAGANH